MQRQMSYLKVYKSLNMDYF